MNRKGKPMVTKPYTPDALKPPAASQHAVVRRLGRNALAEPALLQIVDAADELAAHLGKTADQLTEAEADQAIEAGRQKHANGR